ncbi:MAG: hypothetical protein WC528_01935 [Patescibacteria group bacterium]
MVNLSVGQIEQEKKEPVLKEPAKDFEVKKETEVFPEKSVERAVEVRTEKEAAKKEEQPPAIIEKEAAGQPSSSVGVTAPKVAKTPVIREIEGIMEEDLAEIYNRLDEKQKIVFKVEGEKTATKIGELLQSVKTKARQILELIKRWLKVIPGYNRFFLEQEAKIKTDKILRLKDKEQKGGD